ncbi:MULTISPECIES: bifunctional heptose 7-phosphate kinase/heptose 1-phosphate adenyltransferase [Hymenobacter]|uniref:D-glycero-beta-D-manno-heptose-7-phosphate kinase n=1 Tax=Hymenobacter jejuensis TaxID=2502781 RepID=A0A5B7ZX19_9BACT|nr:MULTISPECIES: bifunctional ADP-heptose synthase [Hymenobacter]MBC6988491.1 D-glycero-beta-D-manno-heptose-7-phosphate kinase [Hymenobacter sp. BT491]QDA59155.1 D-glycero-beta-D-manno-heptose-7-phosphate kinase [Hymenobacter jejuensis]
MPTAPSPTALPDLFDAFNRLTVLIVGDVMMDAYVWGKAGRLSPEAPVPVVNVSRTEQRLGGAANVALNVQAMGATPLLCAVVGDDAGGDQLLGLLQDKELSAEGIVRSSHRPTTVKQRILAAGQHLLRIDSEVEHDLNAEESQLLVARYEALLPRADVVIFEDYDKGVLNQASIQHFVTLARKHGVPTVVDPKKKNFLAYTQCTLFKPNLKELREGLKLDFDDTTADRPMFEAAVDRLRELLQPEIILVTLSERGVFSESAATGRTYIPAHVRMISDVSGAGDTVISIAALCVALGVAPPVLAALANLGGGLVCEQVGVVPIEKQRLLDEAMQVKLLG